MVAQQVHRLWPDNVFASGPKLVEGLQNLQVWNIDPHKNRSLTHFQSPGFGLCQQIGPDTFPPSFEFRKDLLPQIPVVQDCRIVFPVEVEEGVPENVGAETLGLS